MAFEAPVCYIKKQIKKKNFLSDCNCLSYQTPNPSQQQIKQFDGEDSAFFVYKHDIFSSAALKSQFHTN